MLFRSMCATMQSRNPEIFTVLAGPQVAAEIGKDSLHGGVAPYLSAKIALPASSDVGDASWNVPTAQFTTACYAMGTAEHTWQLVAQGKAAAAHKGMIAAAKVMAGSAVDLFEEPETLKAATEDWRKALMNRDYMAMFSKKSTT